MPPTTPLGEFLRARRDAASPDSTVLPVTGRRRVPGLRREEVATLAGLSVDYYTRLEQGRERHPSTQILESVAAVLGLDDDARLHLFRLAGHVPPHRATTCTAPKDLRRLMDGWPDNPALVLSPTYDVLARNRIGAALFDCFTASDNLLLNVFLDPKARSFYADWQVAARNTVAGFRLASGADPTDPRRAEVLTAAAASGEFCDLWEQHDARGKNADRKTFLHPEVGTLTLSMQTFTIRSDPGLELVVYHADPGSPSAQALRLLGSICATQDRDVALRTTAPPATPPSRAEVDPSI